MLERLNRAVDYIERHLDQRIDGAELARITLMSEYHFRRLFSALAGIPLSEYIRRRRLTLAGAEVLAGKETLLDIAVRYGYGSGEAFARAFRALHGVGPAEARRTGAALFSQPRISFRLVVEGSSGMRYRIVEKEGFRIVGKKARLPLVHEGMNPAIVAFVQSIDPETRRRIEELSDQEPRGILNVSHDLAEGRAEGTEFDFYTAWSPALPRPRTWTCCPCRRGRGRSSRSRATSPWRSSTCGGTSSPSGSRRTPIRAGRARRCSAPGSHRTGRGRTRSCGSPWSGPRTDHGRPGAGSRDRSECWGECFQFERSVR
ncbi:transcriptional regulator, AraC family [Thermobispora bispora DSM 43833]|uniref:Transcriptional regulator, AraC family n=1 Tax=Thermobispora bispora (strain ATCC 19993 / DSM 43833 / CBS 139.67 / JCM 10125 / KCTC 9307 / NBRC 14880 / R51) TaxID=469371 RepID=D6Y2Q9_THEBD|nr:transcriptional regulator, AraC family [Thermobispora bispora DSM 43833]